ncbi:hypothetical protein Dimus_020545 [Dionaea muscipula]
MENSLEALFELIKRQKWEKLLTGRDPVYKLACKKFCRNLTVSINSMKEVAKSRLHGVDIELDGMSLATILGIPGNYVLCDYLKEVWEESRKWDTASFMELTYMEYLIARRLINLYKLMIRHMAYVISVPHHELSYGDLLTRVFKAFEVLLNDKEGEDPAKTNFYDHTFLNMCQLKRENGVWWLGIGANRRRDEVENEEAQDKNVEINEEEDQEENVEWETENEEEVVPENVNVEPEVQV